MERMLVIEDDRALYKPLQHVFEARWIPSGLCRGRRCRHRSFSESSSSTRPA